MLAETGCTDKTRTMHRQHDAPTLWDDTQFFFADRLIIGIVSRMYRSRHEQARTKWLSTNGRNCIAKPPLARARSCLSQTETVDQRFNNRGRALRDSNPRSKSKIWNLLNSNGSIPGSDMNRSRPRWMTGLNGRLGYLAGRDFMSLIPVDYRRYQVGIHTLMSHSFS